MRNISKLLLIALLICTLLCLAACPNSYGGGQTNGDDEANNGSEENSSDGQNNENEVCSMRITVGNKEFTATLCDTAAAQTFAELLPLTLNMSELNGNEKYNYMTTTLPTKSERVGSINAGDIMLYGNNCIVLFYKSFSTSYSYTKIGKIDDATGLAQAVGSGGVTVTFQIK